MSKDVKRKGEKQSLLKTVCPVCKGYMIYIGQGDTRKCTKCGYKGHGK